MTVQLSDQEKAAVCAAVEAYPRTFITPLEIGSVAMVEALKDGDDQAPIEALVSLVYRLKNGGDA